MKKLLFLLLLSPAIANAQFVNDFTGQNVILPSDTSKLNHSYYTKHGQIMYMGSTLFVNNGTTWSAIGATNYYAGFGLGLHIDTFYVDTSKIASHFALSDSLGLYATKVALTDTAIARAATAQTNLIDTAADLRTIINTKGSGTVTSVGAVAGTGISIGGTSPITGSGTYTVVNTAPDQTVSLTSGTGISATGTYPNFTITNTSPSSGGTVTSVGVTGGTGISVSGSPITSSGVVTVTATGSLTAGSGMSVGGSFPTYTVTNTAPSSGGTVTSISTTAPITGGPITSTGTIGINTISPTSVLANTTTVSATPAQSISYSSVSSASSLVSRDVNQNAFANNFSSKGTNVVSAAGTTTLTAASTRLQNLTGSTIQTFQLPDATTLAVGARFTFNNNSTGNLTVTNNGGSTILTTIPGAASEVFEIAASTPNGAWDYHYWLPSNYRAGTATFTIPSVTVTAGSFVTSGGSSGQVVQGDGSLGVITVNSGSGISVTGAYPAYTVTNSSPSSGGTVTAFAVAGSTPVFSMSVTNPTTTPTLNVTTLTQNPNTVLAGATSGTTTPTFRLLVSGDIPAIDLTTKVTGVLPIANGGTNATVQTSVNGATFNYGANNTIAGTGVSGVVAGNNISTNTSGTTVTVNSTPSTGQGSFGYNNGNAWASSSSILIGTADGNVLLTAVVATVTPTSPTTGYLKPYANSNLGIEELHSVNSLGVENIFETDIGTHTMGRFLYNGGTVVWDGFFSGLINNAGTVSAHVISPDAINNAPNYMYVKLPGAASPQSQAEYWFSIASRDAKVNNSLFGGGSELDIMFCLPDYVSTQKFFAGYAATILQLNTVHNPSTYTNIIGLAKDSTDATFQFMFNDGSGTATKVNTTITPTVNDVYLLRIYLPSNTTQEGIELIKMTKTSAVRASYVTFTDIPTTSPPTLMYWHIMSNSAAASTAASFGLISLVEKLFNY